MLNPNLFTSPIYDHRAETILDTARECGRSYYITLNRAGLDIGARFLMNMINDTRISEKSLITQIKRIIDGYRSFFAGKMETDYDYYVVGGAMFEILNIKDCNRSASFKLRLALLRRLASMTVETNYVRMTKH